MDLEIRNLQLNFVHTHLTPPVDGLITGIFKDIQMLIGDVDTGNAVLTGADQGSVHLIGAMTMTEADIGESVEPGEPVVRIENDSTVISDLLT